MILLFLIVFLFCSALQWIACNGVLGYIEMHTGAMQCTRWRGNAMLSGEMQMSSMHTLGGNTMQCTLEKEGMQCNAQWGNAKQCTLHTGGRSAMHPWHLSGQPLHLVDEMLMPGAVQHFSLQRWCLVLDGQYIVKCKMNTYGAVGCGRCIGQCHVV